jgi:hypothetical protein
MDPEESSSLDDSFHFFQTRHLSSVFGSTKGKLFLVSIVFTVMQLF